MAKATATDTPDKAEETQEPETAEVNEVKLPEATDSGDKSGGGQIDILLDATVSISVSLGQAEIEVRRLLQSGPGSVLQLDKKIGEPLDLYLRGIRFATGDLVVVGEQLAVRIREILPSAQAATGQPEPG